MDFRDSKHLRADFQNFVFFKDAASLMHFIPFHVVVYKLHSGNSTKMAIYSSIHIHIRYYECSHCHECIKLKNLTPYQQTRVC